MSVSPLKGVPSGRIFRAVIAPSCRRIVDALPVFVSCLLLSLSAPLLFVSYSAKADSTQVAIKTDSLNVDTSADATIKRADTVVKKISLLKKRGIEKDELVNIVTGNKKIRASGWGEYRIGGKCLCCDNTNDGDCIVVHNIEKTEKVRIPQLFDGKTDGDMGDSTSYFGNLTKREHPEPVTFLMVEISLGKMYDVKKVVVYPMIDKEKHVDYLSNCELGYNDQFNRLQWSGMVESKKCGEPIIIELENPVLTRSLLLKVKGGKNILTEAEIFCEKKTDEKP